MLRIPVRLMRSAFLGRESEWAKKDFDEVRSIHMEDQIPREYVRMKYLWQHPLELKQKYKERRKLREAEIQKIQEQESKTVLHSFKPLDAIPMPRDDQIFAILTIAGTQYKVTKDDSVLAEKLEYDIGTQVVFDNVALVGTPQYTIIGRPRVDSAKVYATVEQQVFTDKVIVFKKKRRKGYKKNFGHRQEATILRVDKIEHEINSKCDLLLPVR
jgi:large subunit ribosomal protein L21